MKKLFLFMSWVMLILSGCADEDIIERNSPSFPQSVNTRSAGDGVYDILGYGYDITGPYLDTKSSRAIVFDTNKLLEKGLITPYKLEESRFRYSSGKDVIDFTTNMSSSLQMSTPGILKVIGGASLNIAFGGNSHYNSDYSFAYCTQQYIDSRYRISEADINVLKTCLTKQFIERLSTYTPEQIVEEYGTHVLKDIYLGAKFEVYYMAKSTSSSKKESINAGLGASLFSLFKMDGKFQYDESLAITNKEQSLYYSYFRIKQIQLGYTLPRTVTKKFLVDKLRVYASLDNFFLFTKYPGLDPEVSSTATSGMGVDYGNYPTTKKVVFGLSVTF